ncbi:DUF6862 domain-containing protein [Moraxella marmotae]|uniref:DUF6862 domain-containing protein n=1 Tax=Moraxella marmotae TaxID=3344520 RepID=UPI0035F399AB
MTHSQLKEKISCYGSKKDCKDHVSKYDQISKQQDEQLSKTCKINPNGSDCHRMMQDALEYVGKDRSYYGKASDIKDSTKRVLNVANYAGYHTIDTLDERANYFGAMYGYTGQPWFRVAEYESRSYFSLKGADKTFYSDWIAEAGGVIMKNGRKEFQDIYKNHDRQSSSWSYRRLANEQYDPELQAVHERYYNLWSNFTKLVVNIRVGGEFLNPDVRINKGCEGMPEVLECQR